MLTVADAGRLVTGGVDTHAEMHVASVADQAGRILGTKDFPATAEGYATALAWMRGHGDLVKVGVEGTGSYGAGLARYLAAQGVEVAEVMRPNRQARRRRGKSDAADAVAAALAALNGEASGQPKSGDGAVESIRALQVARRGAVKARTQAGNQLRDLIITAAQALREKLAALPAAQRVKLAARFRPGDLTSPAEAAKAAMAIVARRHQALTAEIAELDAALDALAGHAAPPGFLAKIGVGTRVAATLLVTVGDNPARLRTEASFAALCGASPVGRLLRQAAPPPPQPRRRPAGQLRPVADRLHPDGHRPPHPGLRSPAHRRRQDHKRDHPLPQALRRPRGLQDIDSRHPAARPSHADDS
jgi:transposase